MGFKKLRSVALPEEEQGYIYFTCMTYDRQPPGVRQKIDRLCGSCGGEYADALRALMCDGESITALSMRHYVSESTLLRARRRFYESWSAPAGAGRVKPRRVTA